jgi:ketosteroid isomerase-like protein
VGRSEELSLLRTNAAFYDAFARRDIEAMDELWAHALPVACIHPGWPALHGREDVMSSWRSILLGGGAPEIECDQARAVSLGDAGYVVCLERIGTDALVATNVFAREEGVWQIVHHQAGAVADEPDAAPPGRALN